VFRPRLQNHDLENFGGFPDLAGVVWLGWACLAKTVRKPQHVGVNFDPPMFFLLVLCKILPLLPECSRATFAQNKKFNPQNVFWGPRLAVVMSPLYTKT
jgi:hypothetical protein